MSLEGYSKVFFGPRAPSTPIEVKPSFLKPGKELKAETKGDTFHGPAYGLKHLHAGSWKPKSLAKPSFLADKIDTGKTPKKSGDYETAKAKHGKAEGEAATARAEYEKFENTAKAFKAMGNAKSAKLFSAKAGVAKKRYEQKLLGAHLAKQHMEKAGAKTAKPSMPIKGIAPAGEELSGPTGLTLAKNHSSLSATKKGAA